MSNCCNTLVKSNGSRAEWTYRPSVDIVETADSFRVIADVPGASAEGVDVTLEEGILTVNAAVPSRYPAGAEFFRQEYGVGGYHRRFQVDESIDPEGVSAEYRDGVLTVTLPKQRGTARRQVPVRTRS